MKSISDNDMRALLELARLADRPALYSPLRAYNVRRRAVLAYKRINKKYKLWQQ